MLKIDQIVKKYRETVAVDGLSLEISPGEVFGLLGPNGAGKTTTVNIAVGLVKPDSGKITINGNLSPTEPSTRSFLGVAPQALALYDELSGEENLAFYGKLQGLSGKELSERVTWTLNFVQLHDRRKDRVKVYSGGMQRRLNLAVALIHDPPLLLLDEPTVGVDPQSRNAIFESILELKREGRSILYTTHYMEEAQKLCDRVGIIDHGKMVAEDSVDSLIEQFGGQDIVFAENSEGEMHIATDNPVKILDDLQKKGGLLKFRVDRPNLESVFLNLTGRQLRD